MWPTATASAAVTHLVRGLSFAGAVGISSPLSPVLIPRQQPQKVEDLWAQNEEIKVLSPCLRRGRLIAVPVLVAVHHMSIFPPGQPRFAPACLNVTFSIHRQLSH